VFGGKNAMKITKVTKSYFETEGERVYFFEPLEKEISVEDMQKIVDANEKLVKELEDGTNTISE
jgi:predicted nicotinamide N-methyase